MHYCIVLCYCFWEVYCWFAFAFHGAPTFLLLVGNYITKLQKESWIWNLKWLFQNTQYENFETLLDRVNITSAETKKITSAQYEKRRPLVYFVIHDRKIFLSSLWIFGLSTISFCGGNLGERPISEHICSKSTSRKNFEPWPTVLSLKEIPRILR